VSGSIKIGNVFGIPVRIHATFLLLVYGMMLFAENPLEALGLMGVVFGCVLLHELGHSLVARNFGLRVADITLWPLGGMARMSEIPENSRIEGLIAIAGPAVNFILAGLAVVALGAGAAFGLAPGSSLGRFLIFFLGANVMQGGFNLLPAFPMDGGRLLRAFLGRKRDWLSATEAAVRVGRWVAFVLLVASLAFLAYTRSGFCLMPLIALFVWFEGTRELWSVRMRHGVSPLAGAGFGRPAGPRESSFETSAPAPGGEGGPVGSARRPRVWNQGVEGRGGFSEEEIRRLEANPEPLRRPPEES